MNILKSIYAFWMLDIPLLAGRNYDYAEDVELLLDAFIDSDTILLKVETHHVILKNPALGIVRIWDCNKHYAWACRGVFENNSGKMFQWNDKMASLWTLYKLDEMVTNLKSGHRYPISKEERRREFLKMLYNCEGDKDGNS